MKTKYTQFRTVGLRVVGSCMTVAFTFLTSPAAAQARAKVNDTIYTSSDGAYVAAVREIDTGAVGSGSGILLRTRHGLFPPDGRKALAVGPPQFFWPVRWVGNRTLRVVYGASGPPDPSWKTKWRDVKIVYVTAFGGKNAK